VLVLKRKFESRVGLYGSKKLFLIFSSAFHSYFLQAKTSLYAPRGAIRTDDDEKPYSIRHRNIEYV